MSIVRIYQQLKNLYHFFQAHFWRMIYGFPDKGLHIYGVTGTNGKTTTCFVLAGILAAEYGMDHVGMLTTVTFRVGEKEVVNESKLTTLPSRLVYRYLKDMKQAGVTHAVIEMTSHALDQNRLAGIRLDGAIILNIAREHLDYHQTMAAYAAAKGKIASYLKEGAMLVGKGDDVLVRRILDTSHVSGVKCQMFTTEDAKVVTTPLEGGINKENVLAASTLAHAAGISQENIEKGVAGVTQVPGRMEWLTPSSSPLLKEKEFSILIDYAVTPDALERLYKDVRQKTKGKVLALLGAAGLRDRGKRPDMARAVVKYANILVLTREDPWTEPEEQIFEDLEAGLPPSNSPSPQAKLAPQGGLRKGGGRGVVWRRVVDRREALEYLLQQAKAGDVVVVTGKGAETGMGIGKKIIPWNDREVIEELLKTIQNTNSPKSPKQNTASKAPNM